MHHKTRCFSTFTILPQGLFSGTGPLTCKLEMMQDLYKTELILALWYLGDQITKCVQTLSNTNLLHIDSVLYNCQLCTGKRWYRKCWRCIDLHGKTKQECCTNVDVSIWVLDLCAVTEHWNNMEENMSRTKLQVTTGQAAHQHETALDNETKTHVSMEGKDGRGGCTGGTEAEYCLLLLRFVLSEKWQCH